MSDQGALQDIQLPQGAPDIPTNPAAAAGVQELMGIRPTPLVGPGAPELSDGTQPVDIIAMTHGMLRAIQACADKVAGDALPQDAKDLGAAALHFAQAIITLDPGRLAGGDNPAAARAVTPPAPPVTDRDHDGTIGS